MRKYIKNREWLLVLIFFLSLTLIFFRGVIFSKGIIVGHDWMLPYNSNQMERYLERPLYTWTYDMNLFGVKNPFFIQMPFMVLTKIFLVLGLSGELLSKALIILVFTFSGYSMYLLLRHLGLEKMSSLLGGFILITMPVFFDYSVMGWLFVLFSVGIMLPLSLITFIKSVEEKKIFFSVLTGLLFSVAILQSQSLVWFPMVFFALSLSLVKDRDSFLAYVRSFVVVILIALSLHSSWLPNLFIYKDSGVINSDLALDSVSLGMRSRLSYVNILRGWGGLFNYHYEISYPGILTPLSFLIPLMALSSVLIKIKDQRDVRFGMLAVLVYMFIFYAINPQLMAKIPFSNIIRDTGRFTGITSFALVVLASYFLNYISSLGQKGRIAGYGLTVLVLINALPFYNGELYGEPQRGYDVRMRNYAFPEDYQRAENYLYTKLTDSKVYYPPSGTNIGIKTNLKFFADFREIKDPFRGYSPFPGTIYMYYSSMGKPSKISSLLDAVFDKQIDDNSLKLLGLMNIDSLVIRDDIFYPETQIKNIQNLVSENISTNIKSFGDVKIFSNKHYIPHFYIPDNITYSDGDISILSDAISLFPESNRPGVFIDIDNDDLLQLADNYLIKGERVKPGINELTARKNSLGHEFIVPEDGVYLAYSKPSQEFILPLKGDTATISEKSKYVFLAKLWLKKGKQALSFPIQGTDKKSDLILLRNASDYAKPSTNLPKISFERVNPTKYRVSIKDLKGQFVLIFSESYHEGWKVFLDKSSKGIEHITGRYFNGDITEGNHKMSFINLQTFETWGQKPIADNQHFMVNGYANSWLINPNEIGDVDNLNLIIEYLPQRNFYIGLFISTTIFIISLLYLISTKVKNPNDL